MKIGDVYIEKGYGTRWVLKRIWEQDLYTLNPDMSSGPITGQKTYVWFEMVDSSITGKLLPKSQVRKYMKKEVK